MSENTGSLDGAKVEIFDSREMALMQRVSRDGDCRVLCNAPKAQAIEWLRDIANQWDEELRKEKAAEQS
jgi:hypothetical protein